MTCVRVPGRRGLTTASNRSKHSSRPWRWAVPGSRPRRGEDEGSPQVPQVSAVRGRVAEGPQGVVEPGEHAADLAPQGGAGGPQPGGRPSRYVVILTSRSAAALSPAPSGVGSSHLSRVSSARPSSAGITRCTGSSGAVRSRCRSTAVWKLAAAGTGSTALTLISRVVPSAVVSRKTSSCSAASRSAVPVTTSTGGDLLRLGWRYTRRVEHHLILGRQQPETSPLPLICSSFSAAIATARKRSVRQLKGVERALPVSTKIGCAKEGVGRPVRTWRGQATTTGGYSGI